MFPRFMLPVLFSALLVTQAFATKELYAVDRVGVRLTKSFYESCKQSSDASISVPTGNLKLDELLTGFGITQLDPVFPHDPISMNNPAFFENALEREYKLLWRDTINYPFHHREKFELCRELMNIAGIEHAMPIAMLQSHYIPNDYNNEYWLNDVGSPAAWDLQRDNQNILVVTIDSGVDYTHPDLVGSFLANPLEDLDQDGTYSEADRDFVDNDGNGFVDDVIGYDFCSYTTRWIPSWFELPGEDYGYRDPDPMDVEGHGSSCASVVAARTNNNFWTASPGFNLKTLAVRAAFGYSTSENASGHHSMGLGDDVSPALIYAVNRGARIVSISMGFPSTVGQYPGAINYARSNNCLVFASAGNSNNDTREYPGAYGNVIGVAALGSGFTKANFSSFGTWVKLSAPGVGIAGATPVNQYFSTNTRTWQGTSAASPLAASVAGLILARNPSMSDDDLWNLVLNSVHPVDQYNPNYIGRLGSGCINAFQGAATVNGGAIIAPTREMYVGGVSSIRWYIPRINTANRNATIMLFRPNYAPETIAENVNVSSGSFDWVVTAPVAQGAILRMYYDGNSFERSVNITHPSLLPFTQDFSEQQFPPGNMLQTGGWNRYQSTSNPNLHVAYRSGISSGGAFVVMSDLYTVPVSTEGYTRVSLAYNWSFRADSASALYDPSRCDSLAITYTINDQSTHSLITYRKEMEGGAHELWTHATGAVNDVTNPMLGSETIELPPQAIGYANVRIHFRIYQHVHSMNDSPMFFLDNIRIFPGAIPASPADLAITGRTPTSLSLGWVDWATNEEGYHIYQSTNGITWTWLQSVPANSNSATITGLAPATEYQFLVKAYVQTVESTSNLIARGYTQTATPNRPNAGNIYPDSLQVVITNSIPSNPTGSLYAIQGIGTAWVQADGTFGADTVWRAFEGWSGDDMMVRGLSSNNDYSFRTIAKNAMTGEVSDFSPTLFVSTPSPTAPPFFEEFSTTSFPPPGWIAMNGLTVSNWTRYAGTNAEAGCAMLPFYSTFEFSGGEDFLWTPPLYTGGMEALRLDFDWSYAAAFPDIHNDKIEIAYCLDDNYSSPVWIAQYSALGTNGYELLEAGLGGLIYRATPAPWGNWRHFTQVLPAGVNNQSRVRVGIRGIDENGANYFFDNIAITQVQAPLSRPDVLIETASTTNSLSLRWMYSDGMPITGYGLFTSVDGIDYLELVRLPATDTTYTIEGLQPNTHVWLRLSVFNQGGYSPNYASLETATLCATPQSPLITNPTFQSLDITPRGALVSNHISTLYAIQEASSERYLNELGGVGEMPVWQTLDNWGTVRMSGVGAGTFFQFRTQAKNFMNVLSSWSPMVDTTTAPVFGIPLAQSFTGETFPPFGWSIENDDEQTTWERSAGYLNGNPCAVIDLYHYWRRGEQDVLWTPWFATTGFGAVEMQFKWSYANLVGTNDTLELVYEVFGETGRPVFWRRFATGTGSDSLGAGNGAQYVPGDPDNWGWAITELPAAAMGQAHVRVGFVVRNDYGCNLYIDDVQMYRPPIVAPSDLQISYSPMQQQVTLQWAPARGDVTGYNVYGHSSGYFAPPSTGTLLYSGLTGTTITFPVTGTMFFMVTGINNQTFDSTTHPPNTSAKAAE